jgi:hypothetical protein
MQGPFSQSLRGQIEEISDYFMFCSCRKPPLSTSEIDSMHFLPPCCGISEKSYTAIGRLFWERGVFSGREERSSLGAQFILSFFCALLLYRWFCSCSSVGGSGLHSCRK